MLDHTNGTLNIFVDTDESFEDQESWVISWMSLDKN